MNKWIKTSTVTGASTLGFGSTLQTRNATALPLSSSNQWTRSESSLEKVRAFSLCSPQPLFLFGRKKKTPGKSLNASAALFSSELMYSLCIRMTLQEMKECQGWRRQCREFRVSSCFAWWEFEIALALARKHGLTYFFTSWTRTPGIRL